MIPKYLEHLIVHFRAFCGCSMGSESEAARKPFSFQCPSCYNDRPTETSFFKYHRSTEHFLKQKVISDTIFDSILTCLLYFKIKYFIFKTALNDALKSFYFVYIFILGVPRKVQTFEILSPRVLNRFECIICLMGESPKLLCHILVLLLITVNSTLRKSLCCHFARKRAHIHVYKLPIWSKTKIHFFTGIGYGMHIYCHGIKRL